MHRDIETNRRVLLLAYRRFLEVDRAWDMALREVNSWFPSASRVGRSTLGNPGSPIRRLHDQRHRAIAQLEAAYQKLEIAKKRMSAKRQKTQTEAILFITYESNRAS